ncbi:response regulator [Halobiforma lacisalsi AJ5]|uniref:Response regulator n=2 Tax=Natronobacterium TaxID=2256 RepID=M0LI45_NATLA|nr:MULTISPECIES: response regulator [Halobiforma]APW99539.1 response regulator [Halobiforma lacisalsi AJ5]EMA31665.1 response regulator receiver protein [Halobiforma lacisalsi AJ5]SFC07361.1 CheY chemotaxis protein or a CheY-like REC (receiver) domain [Halobiforma haloterrestris]
MSSYSVLLVEDSEFMIEHVSQALEGKHGFEVEAVATADEARAVFDTSTFDCVISSYELLNESGIHLAASLEEAVDGASVPFILFTGNPLEPLVEEALEAGVSAFVSKSNHATGEMNVFANRIRLAIEAAE